MAKHEDLKWAQALNIEPNLLKAWSQHLPPGKPLVVHAIEAGEVSVPEYLEWACEHYCLPVLSAQYFFEAFEPEFLNQYRSHLEWSPWCFPVGNWEDILIVACSTAPTHPLPNCTYVLADPRAMREVWGQDNEDSEPLPELETPALEKTLIDAPTGIRTETQAFVLDLNALNLPEEEPRQEIKNSKPQAEPTTPDSEAQPEVELHLDSGSIDETSMFTDGQPESPPEIYSQPPVVVGNLQPAKTTPPPVASSQAAPSIKTVESKEAAKAPAEAKSNKGKVSEAPIVEIFDRLQKLYTGAFVARFQNSHVMLHKFSSSLKVANPNEVHVPLTEPSFFRIVQRTKMPYHGYVVDTPVHKTFFAKLGLADLPGCVTAIPIEHKAGLWGVFVVLGSEDDQPLEKLADLEKATQEMLAQLGPSWLNAA